jgi:hypothetical protein
VLMFLIKVLNTLIKLSWTIQFSRCFFGQYYAIRTIARISNSDFDARPLKIMRLKVLLNSKLQELDLYMVFDFGHFWNIRTVT